MTLAAPQPKLAELLNLPTETEWVEFKHNHSEPQAIGEYLSALSNSAALDGQPFGYIVWGIEDGTRQIVGTSFQPRSQKGAGNEDLEPWLNKLLAPKVTTRLLMDRPDLDLMDVVALDKVQKGKEVTEVEFRSLKGKKLVKGRRPNLYVSASVAAATGEKAEYIRQRAFDKDHYKKMLIAYLTEFDRASRSEIDRLLLDKLSEALSHAQKKKWITNLLQEMRRDRSIRLTSGKRGQGSRWELSKPEREVSV